MRFRDGKWQMNISSRCEYACRAVVELGRLQNNEEPVRATDIAEKRGIPEKYLVHIMLQLKRAGIVRSVRGAQGGYMLAQSPEDITLFSIVNAIDGPVLDPLPVEDSRAPDLEISWKAVAKGINRVLEGVTVRDLLDRAAKADMYYI